MKLYDGAALVADRSHAKLVAVRIDGLQRTHLSRMPGRARLRWFPRLTMTVLPPVSVAVNTTLSGRARRHAVGGQVRELMRLAEFEATDTSRSLFAALLDAYRYHGATVPILEDESRSPLNYRGLLKRIYAQSIELAKDIKPGQVVGLHLPPSAEMVVAFMALNAMGAIPLLLDTMIGTRPNLAACAMAGAAIVLSSRASGHRNMIEDFASQPDLEGVMYFCEGWA